MCICLRRSNWTPQMYIQHMCCNINEIMCICRAIQIGHPKQIFNTYIATQGTLSAIFAKFQLVIPNVHSTRILQYRGNYLHFSHSFKSKTTYTLTKYIAIYDGIMCIFCTGPIEHPKCILNKFVEIECELCAFFLYNPNRTSQIDTQQIYRNIEDIMCIFLQKSNW